MDQIKIVKVAIQSPARNERITRVLGRLSFKGWLEDLIVSIDQGETRELKPFSLTLYF
jgi:hypothetical protein